MVSAISICLLAIGLSAASSQLILDEIESSEGPISDRRTFKHGKPLKFLPLIKKHKKFAKLVPHVFSRTSYTEVPIIREAPKPVYKVHRYQGIEVKPVPDITFSTPETIIESHSIEPPSGDFVPTYSSDQPFSVPGPSSSVLLYPVNDKPIFSAPVFTSFPPPRKTIFSFVSVPPIRPIPIVRPASDPIPVSPAPIFAPIPASFPSNPPPPPPPPQPTFSSGPVKIQASVLPPLPVPSPAPIFTSIPVKIQAPVLPPTFPQPPENVFSSVSVKIPAPVLPSVPAPSPASVFSSAASVSPTPSLAFSSLPVSLPPVQFSAGPSSTPSVPVFHPPAHVLPSIPFSATLEPEYTYSSTGAPAPSYIKDISLSNTEIKDSPLPTIETPKYDEITTSINGDGSKNSEHVGFFQKIKGWKADKANAALSHFTHFKQKPIIQPLIPVSHPPHKIPVEISTPHVPTYPNLQFPIPAQPLPLAPAPVFLPPTSFFPPGKYENFPPNNLESPPLFNSYGVPIPHNSYPQIQVSHDRFSSAASEEEPTIVSAPFTEKKEPNPETQQLQSQDFHTQNIQPQLQSQEIFHNHPVYVPENNKTIKEEKRINEEGQPETDDYETQKETTSDETIIKAQQYPSHKE